MFIHRMFILVVMLLGKCHGQRYQPPVKNHVQSTLDLIAQISERSEEGSTSLRTL